MTPIKFPQSNITLAEDQDEYQTLPAYRNEEEFISCWKLSWREILVLLISGRIWLRQLHCDRQLQPQLPQVDSPW